MMVDLGPADPSGFLFPLPSPQTCQKFAKFKDVMTMFLHGFVL